MTGGADVLLLVALALFLAAAAWRYIAGILFEARILKKQKEVEGLRRTVDGIIAEAQKLELEYQALRPQADRLRRDIVVVKRKITELAKGRFVMVQQIGRAGEGRRCFTYEIFHAPSEREGGRPLFDPRFWTHRNMVDVWAGSAQAAARQLEMTFDLRGGYRRSALIEERGRPAP